MIHIELDRKENTVRLKADTVLTVKTVKELIKTLRDSLKMLEK